MWGEIWGELKNHFTIASHHPAHHKKILPKNRPNRPQIGLR
jgi:hypothetical protein